MPGKLSTIERRFRETRGLGYVAAIVGMAGVNVACCLVRSQINEMTVALAMLLVVLFVAAAGRPGPAIVASVEGMLLLNYYFLPPIYTFTIQDPKNWIALSAFFLAALMGGRLSGKAKQKAAEAEREREEALRAEAEVRQMARLQAAVAEVGQEALHNEPSQKVIDQAVARAAQVLRVDYARVLELLPDGKTLLRAGFGWKSEVAGHTTGSASNETPAAIGGVSAVIPTERGPYGVFSVHTRARRGFTKDEANFVQSIANVLGSMIERERDDEALRKSGEQLRDLYNNAPCGYHSIDKDGVYVQINDTELAWLGYTREEIVGRKNFADVLTPETLGTFRENYPKFTAQGEVHDLEYDVVRKDGAVLPVLVSATAIRDSAGEFVASRSVMWDITARRKAENEARMLAELQSVVADLGERALRGAPLSQLLDEAAGQVMRALGVDYSKILELMPNQNALLLRAGTGWKPGYVGHATVGLGADSHAGYTLSSGEPVVFEDLKSEKRFAGTAVLHEHDVVSGAGVVIATNEGPWGVLGAYTRSRRVLRADEVNFLQAAANVLGSAIERGRAEAKLWRVNLAQRVLSKCNEALIRASEEGALLQRICDLIVEEAGYRLCWVGRAENDDPKSVRAIAQAGFEAGYLATLNVTWSDTERGRGPTGACIRTRQTVVMKRIASDPLMAPWRTEALKRGYAASVSIPLILDTGVFGALMIYAAEPEGFGTEEVALLSELASDLAFGIQTLRTRSHIRLLLDSTAEAICGLNAAGDCTWVNRSCVKMLGYPDADALLGRNLHSLAHYATWDGTPVTQDNCPATRALRQGEFVHVDDDVMWRADGKPFPVEFWSHPMRQNGDNIGAVVTFLDITERRRAAQLLVANKAMEQAREREIEIGNRIQQTLLLDQPPQDIPGLRIAAITIPSQKIDGDFYIFLRHSDECLDVIVGDVMGKGIPAALLGAATRSHFLRALNDLMGMAREGKLPEPKDIVMLAHAELARYLIEVDSFVTCCYARLNLRLRRLDLVDCGHTGILLRHAATGLCTMLHGDNLPLGVREGEIYDQVAVAFEPGDLLFFFSDGITEARNGAGELFGNGRLEEYIRVNGELDPGQLADGLRKTVAAFSGTGESADDVTIVAVRMQQAAMAVMSRELDIESHLGELRRVREFVRGFCAAIPGAPVDEESVNSLELAVNEAVSNIMKHAYHGRRDQSIRLEAEAFESHIAIRLFHLGDPFNPAKVAPPPLDGSRESGFGAWIIAHSMDEVRYYRDERGRHCVALKQLRKPSNTGFKGNNHGNHN